MTRHTTSSSEPPPPPIPPGSASADFLEGLALDRLDRSSVIAFLEGFTRRVGRRLSVEAAERVEIDRRPHPTDDHRDAKAESAAGEDRFEHAQRTLVAMIDRLDALIERLSAAGYPLGARDRDRRQADMLPDLPATLHSTWRRLEVAANEAAGWGEGIPTDAWADENLVEHARAAVGELGWLLRQLDEDGGAAP